MGEDRKKCIYCGELIAADAVKCRFCGEWLEESDVAPKAVDIPRRAEVPVNVPPPYTVKRDEEYRSFLYAYFYLPFIVRYFNFKGSDSRKEFWMSTLIYWWAVMGLGGVMLMLTIFLGIAGLTIGLSILAGFWLLTLVPGIALTVRRLHDAGCSGSAFFWQLVPLVGPIILLVKLCQPGTRAHFVAPGTYGPYARYGSPRFSGQDNNAGRRPRRVKITLADTFFFVSCLAVNIVGFVLVINIVNDTFLYYSNLYNSLMETLGWFGII